MQLLIAETVSTNTQKLRLYKYRGNVEIENQNGLKLFERDISMISNSEIWCSDIKNLNDPFEGEFNLEKFSKNLDNFTSFLSFLRIKKKSTQLNERYTSALKRLFGLCLKCGIYSLSSEYDNELMWSHYSNSHSGYCIEYEFENLEDFGLEFSEYYNPKLNIFDKITYSRKPFEIKRLINDRKDIIKFLFQKSKTWEYEKEYRIVTHISGKFNYDNKCIKSIIFGLNTKNKIINKVRKKLEHLNLEYYKMERSQAYKIERKYLC